MARPPRKQPSGSGCGARFAFDLLSQGEDLVHLVPLRNTGAATASPAAKTAELVDWILD